MNKLRHFLVCLPLAVATVACDSPSPDAPDQLRKGSSGQCTPNNVDLTADWEAEHTLLAGEAAPAIHVRTELEPVGEQRFEGTVAVYNAGQLRIVLDVQVGVDNHGGVAIWGSDGTAYDLDGEAMPITPRVVLVGHPTKEGGLSLSGNIHGFDEPILFLDGDDIVAFDEPLLFFDEPLLFAEPG